MGAARLHFVEPMKAATAAAPPYNGLWLYEVKFDGYRVLAVKNGSDVELWSRNQKPLNLRFPEVVKAISKLPVKSCILDGEVCALDEKGRSSFQLLQNQGETKNPVIYYPFDLLFEGTTDLRPLPLIERKPRLDSILSRVSKPIYPSLCFERNAEEVLEKMKSLGAEGAIAKLKTSSYQTGRRSNDWIKIKFQKGQEFVIVGYTLPKKTRKYFGALLLGYYRGDRLVFAGRVGTGFNDKSLKAIFTLLQALAIPEPAVELVQEPSGRWRAAGWKQSDTRWVKPELVAEIQFTEWTEDGILRHPSFKGLRDDKTGADRPVREDIE